MRLSPGLRPGPRWQFSARPETKLGNVGSYPCSWPHRFTGPRAPRVHDPPTLLALCLTRLTYLFCPKSILFQHVLSIIITIHRIGYVSIQIPSSASRALVNEATVFHLFVSMAHALCFFQCAGKNVTCQLSVVQIVVAVWQSSFINIQ